MSLIVRPGILDIAAYVPGAHHLPGDGPIYKMSSNETPLGASPAAMKAYAAGAAEIHRYPDGGANELRGAVPKPDAVAHRASYRRDGAGGELDDTPWPRRRGQIATHAQRGSDHQPGAEPSEAPGHARTFLKDLSDGAQGERLPPSFSCPGWSWSGAR